MKCNMPIIYPRKMQNNGGFALRVVEVIMQVTNSYYEDEVRDGFYIPGMMKRAWAASIEVLEVIIKICKKHNIQYFADAGTLLGAVRHKGFIPWDDDLDICMVREEYNRFLEIAPKELPEKFNLVALQTNEEYDQLFARVINRWTFNFEEEGLKKFHDFPFVVGVDIFPLDYIAPDEEEEECRCYLTRIVSDIEKTIDKELTEEEKEILLSRIEKECKVSIDRTKNVRRQLLFLEEQLFSMYREDEATELAFMPVWTMKEEGNRFKKEHYAQSIEMDFEYIKIAVPVMYDAILRQKYGDYMKLVHNWEYHEYPFYKKQMVLMEEEANVKYPEYIFSKNDLCKNRQERINIKTQLTEFVSLLYEAHAAMETAWKEGDVSVLPELLEACQNGAIAMGNIIEQAKGEGFVTIGILEQYCEVVFQIYEALLAEKWTEAIANNEKLGELLKQIEDSVENDIKQHKEIVFCPYKTSLWDGFESVWRAAVEDENCDVYVVPIPYFYRDAFGVFKEMQYEGEKFPADVPIVRYEDYDFVSRQPDVIFIQNPYDEYNTVISVHPNYYASVLKNYTDKLVYIPSFITDEIDPRDGRAMTNTRCYITMPGVVQADRVIVQSENMKKIYIDVLTEFAGEDTKSVWEEKILGLGSPKYDKGINAKKANVKIADEWKQLIYKPDGSTKKVILYNVSISGLLQNKEKMLEKMKSVFAIFKENQEDVALLWRPHPQMREAVEISYPQLWKEYQAILKQYQEEAWGIYDDTMDIDDVIALCDAYFGDTGSIAQKFRVEGKPVMLQDVECV